MAARADRVRSFICIEIPASMRERVGALQEALKPVGALVSWTRPSNIHLTLKFLGNIPNARIKSIAQAMTAASRGFDRFELESSGVGCFPNPRNPRVLWIGLKDPRGSLSELQLAIEDQLASRGFPRESRRFSPHLTIGRLRSPNKARELAEALMNSGFEAEQLIVSELILMRSDLKPTGSIYTPLFQIPLL